MSDASVDPAPAEGPAAAAADHAVHAATPPVDRDGACLHALFEARVARSPASIALVHGDETLTYDGLNARANQLAYHLRALGVGPDDRVALCVERGPAMIVGLLAILKAGGGYVPLDPTSPFERLAYMLDDSAPVALLTEGGADTPVRRAAGAVPIIELDAASPPWQHLPRTDPGPAAREVGPGHLAYVIYTSGSTGAPKGVMVDHANVTRLFSATDAWFGFGSDDVWTLFHSFAFDFSVWEIWGALLYGGRLVIVPQATTRSPKDFHALLCRERVTVLNQTPSAFRQLIAAQAESAERHALRYVIFGGEALQVASLKPWYERNDDRQPRLVNMYGITETTVHVTYRALSRDDADGQSSPIGVPIPDLQVDILDEQGHPVAPGEIGEMFVGGAGVARGYLNRPELTAERFVADASSPVPGARRYKTGDLARRLPDGSIEFIGRNDFQVKLRGFRIELGEIEARLADHPAVREAVVLVREDTPGDQRLVAYLVPALRADAPAASTGPVDVQTLRSHLAGQLPEYMVPSVFVELAEFPLTVNGKLDRRALPAPSRVRPDHGVAYRAPRTARERAWCEAFARTLGLDRVGSDDHFFELGGNSLLALRVLADSREADGIETPATTFFQSPTPAGLAAAEARTTGSASAAGLTSRRSQGAASLSPNEPIAIVAMSGRFPGARDVEAFWRQLCAGADGHTRFDAGTLDPTLDPALVADPSYVPVRGVLDDVEWFDAAFFGMSPGEAALTDPQLRVFLEICWEALERGGHAPDATTVPVGVFGGMNRATYHSHFIRARPDLVDKVGEFAVRLGNDNEFFATRVAHRLDLTGPAISLNTACSTSLVAIGQAVLSLRAGQCDMALAGGVSIHSPSRSGHLYQEGSMLSPDGLTRPFDADAAGTTFSDGAAVVLLKRHADAVRDGNTIYAVVRDVALNNDGRDKASFTAPSVDGQAALIATAHCIAGVHPRDISYVEAHGTATPLGDPIEVAALTTAFRRGTDDRSYCRIGSVKSNVGHLVMAAGATGVIKTALSLHAEQLPGTLHFRSTNPHIDFASSPFVVCDRLTAWPRGATPRLAGVSSFGVGGTNAHAVLEEAPFVTPQVPTVPASGPHTLVLSARTPAALQAMAARLATHLTETPDFDLADVAFTLDVGRSRFAHRLAVVAETVQDAADALNAGDEHPRRQRHSVGADGAPALVWMFPGQGSQYAGMGRELHAADPAFRAAFDDCLAAFAPSLSFDLKTRLFGDDAALLLDTEVTQPALFCLSYALGRSMLESGLRPSALVGHSIGEFAAAVLAGVMTLDDAARLVSLRGALMQRLPAGSMLGVRLPVDRLLPLLPRELSLAAENAPSACVLAGPTESIDAFAAKLADDGIAARTLHTSHAFHSWMMDGAVAPFADAVAAVTLSAPAIPIVSTLTGTWLTDAEACDPAYWARHLREPVRFSGAVRSALDRHPDAVFVEVGPRGSLSTLVRQQVPATRPTPAAVPMLTDAPDGERAARASAEGRLWTLGLPLAANTRHRPATRRRLRLPTYPFERQRHWADPPPTTAPSATPLSTHALPHLVEPAVMTHTAQPPVSRVPALVAELRVVMEDVVGVDLSTAPATASFIELGLDSLTMTQAALQVKRKYKVPVTFRQLMETHNTLGALAAHLDAQMPAAATVAPVAPVAPVAHLAPAAALPVPAFAPAIAPALAMPAPAFAPVAFTASAPTAARDGFLEQLVHQQMQLMSQQLAMLGGAQAMPAAAVVAAPPVVSAAPSVAVDAPAPTVTAAPLAAAASTPAEAPADAAPTIVRYDVKQAFGAIARIHTTPGELTGSQRTRLDTFVRRYVERTAKSKQYTTAHRPRMADPRVVNGFRPLTKEINYQIVVERSDGSRVWDIDGNEYVDVLNGFGMNLFGWRPKFVNDAVHAQLDLGYEIGPQHPLSGPVCDLICELTGNDRAALCNTGSEAVMAAMRIARTVTERNTVVLFSGSYHGTFDEVLVRAGRGGKGIPGAPGIMAGMFGDVLVLEYGTDETLEIIRSRADDIAAVVVEPVQSRRPDFQPREFLKKLRTLTESSGVCLVFDEVITGFRAHLGGVQALFGIEADLSCYGKVIGGGFAIGAVAGKRGYMDALDGGAWDYGDDSIPSVGVTYFAGTFVRHPITLAAAHASLIHLKEAGPQLQQQLNVHTAAFADELTAFCKEVGAPLQIRHFASLWRVTWLEDHPLQDLLFAMMRNRGIHILDNFPCFMTTAHTTGDIARIKSAFKESIAEMQEAGFLPAAAAAPSADPTRPPHPDARLGRDRDGRPIWFVPDASAPGKFLKYVH